ncbi:two-component sensor histidine kinase [Bacillus haikouensis]|uniref:ATP-binding protein n=1 Tax=Bacillus haikouensis TaxID=1510468 RepID=UPI0015567F93|nr:ATP-binding protein [Bacillus haikouensis]NQD65317.1 two-component sensor histidine kinase [Bacillus haikouensis]
MFILIKTLLVNITILLSLTYNANTLFPFKINQILNIKHKITYGLIGAFSAFLCMLYPIETLGETHFDLRMIAILIVTLYAGWISGSMVLLLVLVYRGILGGTFVITGLSVSILAFLVAVIFRRVFLESSSKLIWSSLIYGVYSLIYIVNIYLFVPLLYTSFYFIYFSVFYLTFIAMVFIIEHLIRTNKQIEEMVYLDKLNMAGQMAASIAHEIRNPLATVRGFIQHLTENTNDEQLKKYSPLILEELDRTNKIITDYLSVAKPGKFQLADLNVGDVVQDCVDLLRPFASYSDVSITYSESGGHWITGDEQYLKQAIMNVIKNGIESIEDKGEVNIEVKPIPSSNMIEIMITDNGKGMDHDELKKIGLPFYTTKTKGTGLGSMVTNKIIREMDGMIEYESEPYKGTIVKISFPGADRQH